LAARTLERFERIPYSDFGELLRDRHFIRRYMMPEFGNPFSVLALGRKVSPSELVRAIRFMIAAEYEAVQLYEQLAESTDNELAKAVLLDIAREEVVHAGEFLTLLKQLQPDEQKNYDEGTEEVEEMMEEMKKKKKKK
jgi:hypothetical protein